MGKKDAMSWSSNGGVFIRGRDNKMGTGEGGDRPPVTETVGERKEREREGEREKEKEREEDER